LEYFFGLHIKGLIDLKIFVATFGIGGAVDPPGCAPAPTPPFAHALVVIKCKC